MKATITTSGIEKLRLRTSRRVNFLGREGIRSVLSASGDEMIAAFKKNIESFTPGTVADLKESTKKQKQAKVGFVYPILKRTMQMMNSMYVRVYAPAGGRGWTVKLGFAGSQGGTLNSTIADAHIRGLGRLPKRDFTNVPRNVVSNIYRRIRAGLRSA